MKMNPKKALAVSIQPDVGRSQTLNQLSHPNPDAPKPAVLRKHCLGNKQPDFIKGKFER